MCEGIPKIWTTNFWVSYFQSSNLKERPKMFGIYQEKAKVFNKPFSCFKDLMSSNTTPIKTFSPQSADIKNYSRSNKIQFLHVCHP